MKSIRLLICALIFMSGFCHAEDLGDLLWQFRQRIKEPTAASSFLSDTAAMLYLDQAQAKVVSLDKNFVKRVEYTISSDSTQYAMPTDFESLKFAIYHDGLSWQSMDLNPGFVRPTAVTVVAYFIEWQHPGQAEMCIRGQPASGTIRVYYHAIAPQMKARTDSCYVPDNKQGLIIEEAAAYYEQAKMQLDGFQLLWNVVRADMGIRMQDKK